MWAAFVMIAAFLFCIKITEWLIKNTGFVDMVTARNI